MHRSSPARPVLLVLATCALALGAGGCKRKGAKAFNQGQAHLKKKRYAAAVSSFEKAVRENPNFGEAYYNLGAARFHLAAQKLDALVAKHGTKALKAALKSTAKPADEKTLSPERRAALAALAKALTQLPAAEADAVVALLRKSLQAKLKARKLFQKGKFVVVRKSSTRRAMLGKLDRVVRLRKLLRERGETDRGLWLAAVARPVLFTATASNPRPAPQKAMQP